MKKNRFNHIQKSFSNASGRYDFLTDFHKNIAERLMHKVGMIPVHSMILDIGMGTGWMSDKLEKKYKDATVMGIDFASGMVDCTKRRNKEIKIIQADARQLPFKGDVFDLIISNLAYQWVEDLNAAFSLSHNILKDRGIFYFSMFGYETFKELFSSFKNAMKGEDVQFKRLSSKGQVSESLLSAGFSSVDVQSEVMRQNFPDMMSLMQWTKKIGANSLNSNFFLGKNLFQSASKYYEKNYQDPLGIYATFEIIWGFCRKNG